MSTSNGSSGPGVSSSHDVSEALARRDRPEAGSTHIGLFNSSAPRRDSKPRSEDSRAESTSVGSPSAGLRRSAMGGRASPAMSAASSGPSSSIGVELPSLQKGKASTPDLPGQEKKLNVHQLLLRKRAGSLGGHARHDSVSSTSSQKVGFLPHLGGEYSLAVVNPRTSTPDGAASYPTTPVGRGPAGQAWPSFFRDTKHDLGGGFGGLGVENRKASTDVLGGGGAQDFGDMNYLGIVKVSRQNDERKKRAFRRWRVLSIAVIVILGAAASILVFLDARNSDSDALNKVIEVGCKNRLSGVSTALEFAAIQQHATLLSLRRLSQFANLTELVSVSQGSPYAPFNIVNTTGQAPVDPSPTPIPLLLGDGINTTLVNRNLLISRAVLLGTSAGTIVTMKRDTDALFLGITTLAYDLTGTDNPFETGVQLEFVLDSGKDSERILFNRSAGPDRGTLPGSVGTKKYPIEVERDVTAQTLLPYLMLSMRCHPTSGFVSAEGTNRAYLTGASTLVFFLLAGVLIWVVMVNVGTRQREKALGEAHDLLRDLTLISQATIKAVPDPMVAFKADGGIVHVNTSACMMTGYTREELLTTNIRTLFIVPEMDIFRSYFMTELTVQRHDDSRFHAEASCGSTGGPTDEIQLFVTVFRDITSRRQAEADLQQSIQEAQDARVNLQGFLAFICHELRNPLHGIMGITELLLDSTTLDKKDVELAENISGSTQLMSAILNDVLDLSKIEGGRLELEVIPFDLNRMIREISSVSKMAAERKNLLWKLTVDEKVPRALYGDPTRLRQILSNLVSNALKFTETGYIELSVQLLHASATGDDLLVEFAVKDTGIGIAPADQPKLFKMFSQAKVSIVRKYGGTGLGLSIVRSLVEKMGGKIDLKSQLGSGTTFFFEVWLQKCDKDLAEVARMLSTSSPGNSVRRPKRSTASPAPSSASGARVEAREDEPVDPDSQFTILLVEDNVTNRRIASQALLRDAQKRFVVVEAEDGVEGVERANERQFDLILMDVNMPRKDGLQATREIRASSAYNQATPVVALTAQAMQEEKNQCFEAGMDHFISKPFKRVEFVARISEIIADERDKASAPETKRQFENIARDQHIIINRTHKPSTSTDLATLAGSSTAATLPFGSPPRSRHSKGNPAAKAAAGAAVGGAAAAGAGGGAASSSAAASTAAVSVRPPVAADAMGLADGAPQGRFAESTPQKNFLSPPRF